MNRRSRVLAWFGAAAIVAAFGIGSTAFAVGQQVQICHANSNEKDPYVLNTPDIAADGLLQGGHNDHGNDGVWYPGAKGDKFNWGDIIPPYDGPNGFHYDGLNWSEAGQTIWENDCQIPGESPDPTVEPTVVPTIAPTMTFEQSFEGLTNAPTEAPTDTDGAMAASPAGSAWLLVVALGALLASIVVLTPARPRKRG